MKLLPTVGLFGFTIVLLLGPEPLVAQSYTDFSGTWQQVNERCDPKPKSKSYAYRAVIDQHDSVLNVDISVSGSRENGDLHLRYEIGGKELVYTGLDQDEFHTSVHWEGDRLVFNITEYERGSKIAASEIWTLSDGGHSLKRVKQETKSDEPVTHTYVLEKL